MRPFTQPFQGCDQRGAGSFMSAAELVWWTLGCSQELFSWPCTALCCSMEPGKGVCLGWTCTATIGGQQLITLLATGNIACSARISWGYFSFPSHNPRQLCLPPLQGENHVVEDYYPTALPHLPLKSGKGGAFLLDLAGKSQVGGTAPLQPPCLHDGVIHSSLGLVVGQQIWRSYKFTNR